VNDAFIGPLDRDDPFSVRDYVILTEEVWVSALRNVAQTMFLLPSEFV